MITLGLDTTASRCAASVVSDTKYLGSFSEDIGRGHAERIARMVGELLERVNLSAADIDRIAVCIGPGSFTGLRVALSFARGFALPRKLPVIGLSALRVLAAQADPTRIRRIISVIDVRRDELCWAAYFKGQEIISPHTQSRDEAIFTIKQMGFDRLAGDGAHYIDGSADYPNVHEIILAWMSRNLDPKNHPPNPLYARGPDAKLPGGVDPNLAPK